MCLRWPSYDGGHDSRYDAPRSLTDTLRRLARAAARKRSRPRFRALRADSPAGESTNDSISTLGPHVKLQFSAKHDHLVDPGPLRRRNRNEKAISTTCAPVLVRSSLPFIPLLDLDFSAPYSTMSTPNSVSDKPHYEHKEGAAYDGELGEPVHDKAFERVMVKKIDRRLLIILGALYAVSLIDRTNISVARVAGMQVELNLGIK